MITETRLIYFSHEALVEAVRLYSSGTARRPSLGVVRRVWLKSIAPPIVAAEIESSETGKVRQIEFSHAEVAAFLILLCRREKIPLPKHSDKLLRVDAGSLCLVISRRAISITPMTPEPSADSDDGGEGGPEDSDDADPADSLELGAQDSEDRLKHEDAAKYQSLRVLVVEDEEFLRTLTVRLLQDIGVKEALSAGDGVEALETLRAAGQPVDVVFCDLDMPRMDGMALMDALRQSRDPRWADAPVIILTVYRMSEMMNEAILRGAFSYLAKPVSRQTLIEQLDTVLAQRGEAK